MFDARVPDFAGMFAKDADKPIVRRLKAEGKLVEQDTIVHPYPHCYRTDQPLLYMALSTWFMKVEPLRERLVANNAHIHWVPEHVGSGRFGNWLAGARDWNLARNRFWGTPLPIWRCDRDPSDMECFGSVAELEARAGLEPGTLQDLHRESVDPITFPSRKTPGGTMRRVSEVFDCWFESGSMPYAQNHYPFDADKKAYVEQHLPADFIAEGLDQTRGWFYTLHVLATALFGRPAFKNVIVNGLILAEDGKKMSKRLKNYPDPMAVIERYGADALRAYLVSGAAVRAEPMRFSERGVRDMVRTAILPLWNAYKFLVTYARADGWSPSAADLELRPSGTLDRWIVSRLAGFVDELAQAYESYHLYRVVPVYQRFCDDLNNWYIRRGRRRYWRGADEGPAAARDKHEAYATLFRVLVTVTHAMAPVLPFVTEWLYLRLLADTGLAGDEVSVHERAFPTARAAERDETLEARVASVRRAVALGMAARERAEIPVRRPLARVTVACPDPAVRAALAEHQADLLGELNVKALDLRADDGALVTLAAKANFKALGRRLGPRMKAVAAAVAALDEATIRRYVQDGTLEVAGETLGAGDILVTRTPQPGQVAESDGDLTVALHTEIDDTLRREGLAREIINRVQNLRKQADLDVSDRVELTLAGTGALAGVLDDAGLRDLIARETLARALRVGAPAQTLPHRDQARIDGDTLDLGLRVAGAEGTGAS